MMAGDEMPRRPADAYAVVAALLPRWYFTSPPPPTGYDFAVYGADGVGTHWRVHSMLANELEQKLRASRSIRSVQVRPYVTDGNR